MHSSSSLRNILPDSSVALRISNISSIEGILAIILSRVKGLGSDLFSGAISAGLCRRRKVEGVAGEVARILWMKVKEMWNRTEGNEYRS